MLEFMKIVGVSAVLSAGFVTASERHGQPDLEAVSGKTYTDRVPQGEPGEGAKGDVSPAKVLRITYSTAGLEDAGGAPTARGAKGDLQRSAPDGICASQAWPNIASECLDGAPLRRSVRMITVEERDGANTSVLVRVPAAEVAQR